MSHSMTMCCTKKYRLNNFKQIKKDILMCDILYNKLTNSTINDRPIGQIILMINSDIYDCVNGNNTQYHYYTR